MIIMIKIKVMLSLIKKIADFKHNYQGSKLECYKIRYPEIDHNYHLHKVILKRLKRTSNIMQVVVMEIMLYFGQVQQWMCFL